jgi:uracil-DNA glycosylase family 4
MNLSKKYDPNLYINHSNYEKIKASKSLDELKNILLSDKNLEIAKKSINLVFSDGNESADIMIIGEAPGKNEDEKGLPFCGRSGNLLNEFLSKIELNREKNIYIANVINWRPENNRVPTDDEIQYCLPYLEKHISLKKPKIIITLGLTAIKAILMDKMITLAKLRKKILIYKNYFSREEIPIIATFHPSYILRRRDLKNDFLDDLKFIEKQFSHIKNKKS